MTDNRHRPIRRTCQILTVFTLALLYAQPAWSGEGRLEINQACAENAGCFAGDDPGFPVEIIESGSYVLTSNLYPENATVGIELLLPKEGEEVKPTDVDIDLNGFAIRGTGSCDGRPVTECTGGSVKYGINSNNFGGVVVRNGEVSGMGETGIALISSEVTDVQVFENGEHGIHLEGGPSTIRNVTSSRNGAAGIDLLSNSSTLINVKVEDNGTRGLTGSADSSLQQVTAQNNGHDGIYLERGSVIQDSTAAFNDGNGIRLGPNGSVKGSTARGNGADGFRINFGSVVVDSTAYDNAEGGIDIDSDSLVRSSTATGNAGNGIFLRGGNSNVINTTVNNNGDDGIDCDPNNADAVASGVKGNVLIGNASLALRGCTEIGTNLCGGDTSCP